MAGALGSLAAPRFQVLPIGALSAERIGRIEPGIVLSWLIGPSYDATEIAEQLRQAGFRGTYFAIAHDTTHAEMIAREIRAQNPDFAFEVLRAQV